MHLQWYSQTSAKNLQGSYGKTEWEEAEKCEHCISPTLYMDELLSIGSVALP